MARNTGKAAVSMEEFSEWEKGIKKKRQKKAANIEEPEAPKISGQLPLGEVDYTDVASVSGGRRNVKRGPDGSRHIGYDVAYVKRSDGKVVSGWLSEGDYIVFRSNLFRSTGVGTDSMEY